MAPPTLRSSGTEARTSLRIVQSVSYSTKRIDRRMARNNVHMRRRLCQNQRERRGLVIEGASRALGKRSKGICNALARETPPGPPALPLVGNLLQVGLGKATGVGPQPHEALRDLAGIYGDVMQVQMGSGEPWVVLSSPDMVHEAFLQRGADFSGRPMVSSMSVSSGGGKGFAGNRLTPELKELRREAFANLFGTAQLEASQSLLTLEARAISAHFLASEPPFKGAYTGGGGVLIRPALRQGVTNMVLLYVFGSRVAFATEDPESRGCPLSAELSQVIEEIWAILTDTGTTLYDLIAPAASDELTRVVYQPLRALVQRRNSILRRLIHQHRQQRHSQHRSQQQHMRTRDPGTSTGRDGRANQQKYMIDILLEGQFSDEEILYVLVDMFVAGVNTVSSTMEWMLLLTAKHRNIQHRARIDLSRAASLAPGCTLKDAPFVGALLKEVLRMKQPLLLPRQAVRDTTVGGYHVPEGTIVYANNYALTHDPKWWIRPEEFRPTRFLEEEKALHHTYGSTGHPHQANRSSAHGDRKSVRSRRGVPCHTAQACKFIPFSIGQRMCPGARLAEMQLEILAVHILQNMSWEPVKEDGLVGALGGLRAVDLREEYSLTLMPAASQQLRFMRV